MVDYRNIRMDLMTSKEVQRYLQTNDVVIQPVGCFEFHGPRVPLACDTLNSQAVSLLLAERWKCLVAPPVNYSYPGASGPWPGSMNLSPNMTQELLKEIALGWLAAGFGRVVFCYGHAPLTWMLENVTRSIYMEHRKVVLRFCPNLLPADVLAEQLGYRGGEDVATIGAMKILGLHGAYDPAVEIEEDKSFEMPFESLRALSERGASGPWLFSADYQHTGLRSGLSLDDADKIVAIMRQAAARYDDVPDLFAQYQRDLQKLCDEAPWDRPDIWSV